MLASSSARNLLSTTSFSSLTTTPSHLRSLSTNTTGQVFGKGDVYLFTLQRGWYLVATAPFIDKYIIVQYSGEWLKPLPCFALKNVCTTSASISWANSCPCSATERLKICNKGIAVRYVFTSIHLLISLCYSPLPNQFNTVYPLG